jgi:hypothetical protein
MSKAAELAALIGSQTALSNRNLIINGAMQVNQRNATTTASGYTVDRFNFVKSTNFDELVMAVTQDTDTPSGQGFSNSLKIAITTAESAIASDEVVYLDQRIEGQNLQHLGFGTSSAKSITLSFFVKSPLAGKHSVLFYDATNTRSNLQAYTVSSANTWEKITITIDGDQSGGFANTNASGLIIFFPLAGGSDYHGTPHTGWGAYTQTDDFMFSDQVNLAGQTGNFFLTGVQLEIGEVATPFEHEDFGTTLAKCQRYYDKSYAIGTAAGTATFDGAVIGTRGNGAFDLQANFTQSMRAAPTITTYNPNDGTSGELRNLADVGSDNNTSVAQISEKRALISGTTGTNDHVLSVHFEAVAEL